MQPVTDQYFRGYDNQFPDFYRVDEWAREFDHLETDGNLPNFELVRVMHDHTGSFATAIDSVSTLETQKADNDYAVGRIVEKVAKSPYYSTNTLAFLWRTTPKTGPITLTRTAASRLSPVRT